MPPKYPISKFSVISVLLFYLLTFLPSRAQTVRDLITQKHSYASCNYDTYPDSIPNNLTPSPKGKRPFYISHYEIGRAHV